VIRSYKYRLYPNASQAEKLDEMLGRFCSLYNAALQERIEAYQKQKVTLTFYNQSAHIKTIRADDPNYRQFSHTAKQKVLRRLDKAFKAFFQRVKKGQTPGFPRFKPRSRYNTAEFKYGDGLRLQGNRVRMVGIPGGVKVRWHRDIPEGAKIKAATVSRRQGRWFICFQFEINDVIPVIPEKAVGVDLGLSSFIATSDGEAEDLPQFTKDSERRLRVANRELSRRKKGSIGWKQSKKRVQRVHNRTHCEREKFLHKQANQLVSENDLIVIENLNVKGMARGMLAKSVNNAAWGKFTALLTYKAESAGKTVETVNPAYTSQTCSSCGTVKPKTLAVRMHTCECGLVLDRDVNAAVNVLHKSSYWSETGQGALTSPVAECVASKAVCFS